MLPDEILWRTKEAFSDGVSTHGRSLFTILQEKIAKLDRYQTQNQDLTPIGLEKHYYKSLFEEKYRNALNVVPYFWMPKFIDATDPSARTLTIQSLVKGGVA